MFHAERVSNFTKPISGSANDNDDTGGVITAKVTAMVVLFCASTFFGLLPYKFQGSNMAPLIIPYLLSFGGGVLLSSYKLSRGIATGVDCGIMLCLRCDHKV